MQIPKLPDTNNPEDILRYCQGVNLILAEITRGVPGETEVAIHTVANKVDAKVDTVDAKYTHLVTFADPIAYYNQTGQDYELSVGETAKYTFTNTTSMPLRIKTYSGTAYELINVSQEAGTLTDTYCVFALYPNNTTYTNAFYSARIWRNSDSFSSDYTNRSHFHCGHLSSITRVLLQNNTNGKHTIAHYNLYTYSYGYPSLFIIHSSWRDTTTAWTSLGTFTLDRAKSSVILVRRVL